jgi:hypothetical protein
MQTQQMPSNYHCINTSSLIQTAAAVVQPHNMPFPTAVPKAQAAPPSLSSSHYDDVYSGKANRNQI